MFTDIITLKFIGCYNYEGPKLQIITLRVFSKDTNLIR